MTTPPPYGAPGQDPYGGQPGGFPPGGYGSPPPGYGPQYQEQGFPNQPWPPGPGYPVPPGGFGGPPVPPNYLGPSIALTVVSALSCCLNLLSLLPMAVGIAAIVFSSQVNSRTRAGDLQGALSASRTARTLCLVAGALLALSVVLSIILFAIGFVNLTVRA
ncbi:MAG: CD225/dispanin family protein [Frankia sp.]|nr:CD225/dispanin family protein [Frankia sp.]